MFITGPDVVKTVTGEDVTQEELGGALTHASKSGVAAFVYDDEQTALAQVRYLLSFLPAEQPRGPAVLRVRRRPRPLVRRDHRPHPRRAQQALRHEEGDRRGRRRRRVLRGQRALGDEHRVRVRPHRRSRRRHRRQPAAGARGHARHRRVGEGGALRAHVRRVQRPAGHVRRRARASCPAPTRSTAASSATAPSCSTRTARRRCRGCRSSPARPTAAPTSS